MNGSWGSYSPLVRDSGIPELVRGTYDWRANHFQDCFHLDRELCYGFGVTRRTSECQQYTESRRSRRRDTVRIPSGGHSE